MSDTLAILDQHKAIQLVAGNKKLADDLLAMLIKELPAYKQSIQKELQEGNKEELRKIIHKIHGGLRYIGAPALMEIVSQTDYELLDMSDDQLKKNITRIYQEIDRLLKEEKYSET
ncbi:MAG: Hpt domain-containing protein [Gammaproteobacteria bacterium]|nr:Hpt domain-containing protein [Gammaproteobacteria bacterium]